MNLFFSEPRSSKSISIWIDDPRYGVMLEDNVPNDMPSFSRMRYSDEKVVRELIEKLVKKLGLPADISEIELDISFK